MCEVMTALALGLGVVGGAIGVAGALKQGRDAQATGYTEAAVYESQATARLEKSEFDVAQAANKFERFEGTQRARIGGSGVSAASFYDVFHDDAMEAALERDSIRWTAQHDAAYLKYQGGSAIARGNNARSASYVNAAGAAINAASPFAMTAYRNRSTGTSGGAQVDPMTGVSTSGWIG